MTPSIVGCALALLCGSAAMAERGPTRPHRFEEPRGYRLWECAGTQSKPQSKLWYAEGSWWAVLDSPTGNRIFRLDGFDWVAQDAREPSLGDHDGRADVLWDGHRLFVLVFSATPRLYELTYDRRRHAFERDRGFPVTLPIPPGSETMVIDEDGSGRLWATYATGGTVYAAYSKRSARDWATPGVVLETGVHKDDIASVIAFGSGFVGVFWSDQNRDAFGFRVHAGADAPDRWGDREVVDAGAGHADDHVHLTADRLGRVFAVTKDDENLLNLHRRDATGTWVDRHDLLGGSVATRPTIMLAPESSTLVLLYTRWHEGLETIESRSADVERLEFGAAAHCIVVPGINLNDVSGTKQPLPPGGFVAVCNGGGQAWWMGWGGAPPLGVEDAAPPAAPWPLAAHAVAACPEAALALAFDEGEGHATADASPGALSGILGGPWAGDFAEPKWTAGVSGHALLFDGDYDFVEVAPEPALDLRGSMTVEAWVRRGVAALKEALLCKGDPGERNYQMRWLQNDHLEFLWESVGGMNHRLEGRVAVRDSLWHHVACVYDCERRESRIYLDGRLDAAAPDSGVAVVNASPLFIGVRMGDHSPKDWFHGAIDAVRITSACRYRDGFVPERGFAARGDGPFAWLEWTPRVAPGLDSLTYDVYRRVGDAAEQRLNGAPLVRPVFCDHEPPVGSLHYAVRPHASHPEATVTIQMEWPPAHPGAMVTR